MTIFLISLLFPIKIAKYSVFFFTAPMSQIEFLEFYKASLGLNGEDVKLFEESINLPLPSAFRITPTSSAEIIRKIISKYSFIHKVPYLEDVFSFELKSQEPEYKEFIDFLIAQTDIGNIQRQEIVSFLPHLFMSLETNHKVLETCASPGSKTKNLLEIVKEGLIVSNDKSSSRVNILISESSKKATPSFIVTKCDAMNFPNFSCKFDRICCDVPCSGDGTYRKNPAILPKWRIQDAISLSNMQSRILKRALELLKVEGILVYSTCSLSPIEDEWVINSVIGDNDNFEILSDFNFIQFENLDKSKIRVRKGITNFKNGTFEFDNPELSKCFRVLPHDQNTGGFFITVIKKKKETATKEPVIFNKMNSAFVELDEASMNKISKTCDVTQSKCSYVSFNSNFKNIFAVSEICHDFLLNNPKLKIAYAGIKAFTESDLRKDVFRPKSAFLELENIKCDLTLPMSDFRKLVQNRTVALDELEVKPEGLFIATVEGLEKKLSGFSGGNKVFLYIDDNHRKAYSYLYFN